MCLDENRYLSVTAVFKILGSPRWRFLKACFQVDRYSFLNIVVSAVSIYFGFLCETKGKGKGGKKEEEVLFLACHQGLA